MDTTLGYDPHRERQANLQLGLIALGTVGGVMVLTLRMRGDERTANLLTLIGIVTGGILAATRVAESVERSA